MRTEQPGCLKSTRRRPSRSAAFTPPLLLPAVPVQFPDNPAAQIGELSLCCE